MNDKNKFPEEDEVLFGTVIKIEGTSVFVQLENKREGVISFSEIAPGRIRTIRDYVRPGKKIACKVLRVDKEKGHIDLSLRRVTAREKKELLEMHEKEKEVLMMLNVIVKEKKRLEELIEKIREKINLSSFLEELAEKPLDKLIELGFTKEEALHFIAMMAEKAKEKKVQVKVKVSLSSEAEDGIEKIKKVLGEIEEAKEARISYISAPHYMITLEDKDYKEANKRLKQATEKIEAKAKEFECSFDIKK